MPSGQRNLVDHEWSRHGTCSGLGMQPYFEALRTAAGRVRIPDALKASGALLPLDQDAWAQNADADLKLGGSHGRQP